MTQYYSVEEQKEWGAKTYSAEEHVVELELQVEELQTQLREANTKRREAESDYYQYKTAYTVLVKHLTK